MFIENPDILHSLLTTEGFSWKKLQFRWFWISLAHKYWRDSISWHFVLFRNVFQSFYYIHQTWPFFGV
jgi:hypothetical protein